MQTQFSNFFYAPISIDLPANLGWSIPINLAIPIIRIACAGCSSSNNIGNLIELTLFPSVCRWYLIQIRFQNAIPWEQRKFEDIAQRASVIGSAPELPRVEYEDIISGTGQLNKDVSSKASTKAGIEFHVGDVLYGKLRPYLQNWLLPPFSGLAVGDFWVLRPQNIDSAFLYRLVQSRQFDEVANQSSGTKMPRADWEQMKQYKVLIPDRNTLEKFNQYVWTITRKIKILALSNKNLLESRDRLLPKLMSGELEV